MKFIILLTGIIFFSSAVIAKNISVAVLNFSNSSGSPGLNYLSTALADSLSTTLDEFQDIDLVERRDMNKILQEIELQQSGLIEGNDLVKMGKMMRADVLILGRYTGTPGELTVHLRAVQVETARILTKERCRAPLSTLFDCINQRAYTIGSAITGKKYCTLSVYAVPSGAAVYIDGIYAGPSPLINYKTMSGKHQVNIIADGYLPAEKFIETSPDQDESLDIHLTEDIVINRSEIGIGINRISYLKNDSISPSILYSFMLGHTYQGLTASGEFAFTSMDNNTVYASGFGSDITVEQYYSIKCYNFHLGYSPFIEWDYFSPYIGGFIGYSTVKYYRISDTDQDLEELNEDFGAMLNYGARFVMNVVPLSQFTVFFDLRYIYYPRSVAFYEYEGNLFGPRTILRKEFNFSFWSIGGGLKMYF